MNVSSNPLTSKPKHLTETVTTVCLYLNIWVFTSFNLEALIRLNLTHWQNDKLVFLHTLHKERSRGELFAFSTEKVKRKKKEKLVLWCSVLEAKVLPCVKNVMRRRQLETLMATT